jgi:hypothetical protein
MLSRVVRVVPSCDLWTSSGSMSAGRRPPRRSGYATWTSTRRKRIAKADLERLMTEADASREYRLPRQMAATTSPVDGMMATIMTRLDSYQAGPDGLVDVTDPDFLSRTEMAGRRQALEYARFLPDRVPGYEHTSLAAMRSCLGIRETRRA